MRSIPRTGIAALAAMLLLVASAGAVTPDYFQLPNNRRISTGIAADASGNIWFGAEFVSPETIPPLGRLVPANATPGTSNGIDFFPTPSIVSEGCCANFIRAVTFDSVNQRIWFVRSTGAVGYGLLSAMSPTTTNGMSVLATTGHPDLGGIAVDKNGLAWFTERSASNASGFPGNRVGSTDGSSMNELVDLAHQSGSLDSIRYDAKPTGITIDKNGVAWFAEADSGNAGYRIGKVAGSGGGSPYTEYPVTPCAVSPPCSGSYSDTGPLDLVALPDGTIWFTNQMKNSVVKLDPQASTFTHYSLTSIDPTLASGQPRKIVLAPDGTLWVAEFGYISHPAANAIIRLVPTDPPTATVYKLGAGKSPLSVAADASGNIWFNAFGDSAPDFVGRLAGVAVPSGGGDGGDGGSSGGGTTTTPTTSTTPPATGPAPGGTVIRPASVGVAQVGNPAIHGGSMTVDQICVGPPQDPCSLVYILSAHEYVTGFPGTSPRAVSAAKKRKTRLVVVGSKTVTLHGGQHTKVVIKLNAKGRKILKRDGRLHVSLQVKQKLANGKTKVVKSKKATFRQPH